MIIKYEQKDVMEFLCESNKIEGVYDQESLVQALYAWAFLATKKKLTVGVILKTHKILMLNSSLLPSQKGYFRTVPVWVGGREGIKHSLIERAMSGWVDLIILFIKKCKKIDPIILKEIIQTQHVEFEHIHPFIDGNGRVGRMLLNWTRMQMGLPILIIKATKRQDYYRWFKV